MRILVIFISLVVLLFLACDIGTNLQSTPASFATDAVTRVIKYPETFWKAPWILIDIGAN